MKTIEVIARGFFALLITGVIWLAVWWFNAPFWPMLVIYLLFLVVDTLRDLVIDDIRASKGK